MRKSYKVKGRTQQHNKPFHIMMRCQKTNINGTRKTKKKKKNLLGFRIDKFSVRNHV